MSIIKVYKQVNKNMHCENKWKEISGQESQGPQKISWRHICSELWKMDGNSHKET